MQGKRLVKHSFASLRQQTKNNFYLGVYQLICFFKLCGIWISEPSKHLFAQSKP